MFFTDEQLPQLLAGKLILFYASHSWGLELNSLRLYTFDTFKEIQDTGTEIQFMLSALISLIEI